MRCNVVADAVWQQRIQKRWPTLQTVCQATTRCQTLQSMYANCPGRELLFRISPAGSGSGSQVLHKTGCKTGTCVGCFKWMPASRLPPDLPFSPRLAVQGLEPQWVRMHASNLGADCKALIRCRLLPRSGGTIPEQFAPAAEASGIV